MQYRRSRRLVALVLTLALHALVAVLISHQLGRFSTPPRKAPVQELVIFVDTVQPPPREQVPEPEPEPQAAAPVPDPTPLQAEAPAPPTPLAAHAAPPAPSAEDWAFAARYTLKNSKGYRHSFGQQLRSLMGIAVEGPDQGMVRFRVEIAPDGRLARLETLWSTSPLVEQLARQAVEKLPPLPPTPTGQPLIFEKTISFSAFASDDPPFYKDDCLPDPPAFRNPFAWDGHSPPQRVAPSKAEPADPQALAECLKQLPRDSLEAEAAHDRRQLEQWGSSKLGR